MKTRNIKLRIIAEPPANTRKVLEISLPETVFFSAYGKTNYVCGKCKGMLANSIDEGLLSNIVLKCNICKSYNDIPAVTPPKRGKQM